MRPGIVVIGGGEHARVVVEAIRAGTHTSELLGFVDPEACEETIRRLDLPRLGGEDALERHRGVLGVLGFAALETRGRREEAVRRLTPLLSGWAVAIHSAAWVSPTATVGEGTVIMAGAVVQTGARIGAHCVINTGAVVEHDAVLGEHVQLAPGATLGGAVSVGPSAYIGLGAAVRDHTSVGAGATVGMGAVVVRDVAAGARVVGVPAR
jgi:sugar O-acyltransferase (sialic acid O-acetyltransferase NeuD family)